MPRAAVTRTGRGVAKRSRGLALSGAFALLASLAPVGAEAHSPSGDEAAELLDLDLEDLLQVEISTASKAPEAIVEAPGIVSVITAKEIREFGAVSLFEVLERAPSLAVSGSYLIPQNVASFRRDLPSHLDNHTLVLIDGRPFRDFTQGGFNRALYNAFPVDAIRRIELIRGPGSVLYGTNAFSGIINIITKDAETDPGYAAALGAGSDGATLAGVSAAADGEDVDAYFNARLFDEDGWTFEATDELGVTDSTRYGEEQLGAYASLAAGNFSLSFFGASSDEVHLGPTPIWPEGRLTEERYFIDLGYSGDLSQVWSLEGHVTYNHSEFEFPFDPVPPPIVAIIGSDPPTLNESESSVFELTGRGQLGEATKLTLGIVADARAGETKSPMNLVVSIPEYSDLWWSAYAQLDYRVSPWLKLVGGLQWNKPEDIDADVVPRAAAVLTFSKSWGAKLLYGEAFRAPTELERSLVTPVLVGNSEIEPEEVATTEAQVFYHRDDFHLALTLFHSEQRELLLRVPTSVPNLDTYQNLGKVRFQGVEVEGRYSFSESTYVTGSFLYAEDENRAGDAEVTPVSETMCKLGVAHRWPMGHSVGIFNSYFDEPVDVTGLSGPNPAPEAVNLLTANVVLNLSRLAGKSGSTHVFLKLHGINLLDEDVLTPEYVRRNINALPSHGGAALYAEVEVSF